MHFSIFHDVRQGARLSNQDRIGYAYTPECALLVVCDGMGGHLRGDIAAHYVVEYLRKVFRDQARPSIKNPSSFLANAMLEAHHSVIAYAKANALSETPRTTCVAAIVQDSKVWWAHVGDSRLYMIRDGQVLMRTKDHSHVQMLIDQGSITEQQAMVHRDRNKIYSCLGQPTVPRIDVEKSVQLKRSDILLLATDGLWGPLPSAVISAGLARGDIKVSVPMLMDLAEALAGRECDNLSAVAMVWWGVGDQKAPESEIVAPELRDIVDDDISVAMDLIRGTMTRRLPMAA